MDGIDADVCPAGTRFIYRSTGSSRVCEDTVLEWSGSGLFVKLKDAGWMSLKDASLRIVLLEVLYAADEDGMCPNCVTPWKCNGPHKS